MKRADLQVGDEVAVYVSTPVPVDPYSRIAREAVRRSQVRNLPAEHVVGVTYGDGLDVEYVSPRQVIAKWGDWESNLARRNDAASGRAARQAAQLEVEAQALGDAQRRFPTARMEKGCIIIPVEDWIAGQ